MSVLVMFNNLMFGVKGMNNKTLNFGALLKVPAGINCVLTNLLTVLMFILGGTGDTVSAVAGMLNTVVVVMVFIIVVIMGPPMKDTLGGAFMPRTNTAGLVPTVLALLKNAIKKCVAFSNTRHLVSTKVANRGGLGRVGGDSIVNVVVTAVIHVFLFLTILNIIIGNMALSTTGPTTSTFGRKTNRVKCHFTNLILLYTTVASVVNTTCASISFLGAFDGSVRRGRGGIVVKFVVVSATVVFVLKGPTMLLMLTNTIGNLVLPVALTVYLVTTRGGSVVKRGCRRPMMLAVLKIVIMVLATCLNIAAFMSGVNALLWLEGVCPIFELRDVSGEYSHPNCAFLIRWRPYSTREDEWGSVTGELEGRRRVVPSVEVLARNSSSILIRFNGRVDPRVGQGVATAMRLVGRRRVRKIMSVVPTFYSLLIGCSPHIVSCSSLGGELRVLLGVRIATNRKYEGICRVPMYCKKRCNPSVRGVTRRTKLSMRRMVGVRSSESCLVCVLNFLPNFYCLNKLSREVRAPHLTGPEVGVGTKDIKVNNSRAKVCPLSSPKK